MGRTKVDMQEAKDGMWYSRRGFSNLNLGKKTLEVEV